MKKKKRERTHWVMKMKLRNVKNIFHWRLSSWKWVKWRWPEELRVCCMTKVLVLYNEAETMQFHYFRSQCINAVMYNGCAYLWLVLSVPIASIVLSTRISRAPLAQESGSSFAHWNIYSLFLTPAHERQ